MKQSIVAILIVLLFSAPSSSSQIYGVAKYSFNLMSKPSFDGSVIVKVNKGERLTLIEIQGTWIKASKENYKGWLSSTWVDIHGDILDLPNVQTPAIKESIPGVAFKPFDPPIYGNARFRVFAREGPSIKSNSSLMLKKTESVIVLGLQDNYLKIKNDEGETAWISSHLIDLSKNKSDSISVNKKFEQDKIESKINELNSKFQELPETDWKDRIEVLNQIIEIDPGNNRVNELIGEYSNKILKEKIQILEAKVTPLPASDISGNLSLYSQLLKLDPNNERYKMKVAYYSERLKQLEKLQKKQVAEKKERNKQKRSISDYEDELTLDFKGITLGSDISAIKGSSRFSCRESQGPIADQICKLKFDENETIAGVPVEIFLLIFYSGKLETISITFDSNSFSEVVAALKEKYGSGEVETEAVQNRMGATFENKIYLWRRGEATLKAIRYSGKIDRSSVIYLTDFALDEYDRRKSSTIKEKADDL